MRQAVPVLRMLRDVAGIDQVMFGAGFPFLRRDLAVDAKQRILESSELNHLEKDAVLSDVMGRAFFHVCIPWFTVSVRDRKV